MRVLASWEGSGETATFKVYINPLINWIWLGGIVFIAGTLVAGWPEPEKAVRRVTSKLSGVAAPAK